MACSLLCCTLHCARHTSAHPLSMPGMRYCAQQCRSCQGPASLQVSRGIRHRSHTTQLFVAGSLHLLLLEEDRCVLCPLPMVGCNELSDHSIPLQLVGIQHAVTVDSSYAIECFMLNMQTAIVCRCEQSSFAALPRPVVRLTHKL